MSSVISSKTITSFRQMSEYPVGTLFLGVDGIAYRIIEEDGQKHSVPFSKNGFALDKVLIENSPFGEISFDGGYTMSPVFVPETPTGFWKQIDHQLQRIGIERADTFDKVREILLDPIYADVQKDVHLNGARAFDKDSAFFAGSGGDATLRSSLVAAGWETVVAKASYYYVVQNHETKEVLTYIEGDVVRGDQIAKTDIG